MLQARIIRRMRLAAAQQSATGWPGARLQYRLPFGKGDNITSQKERDERSTATEVRFTPSSSAFTILARLFAHAARVSALAVRFMSIELKRASSISIARRGCRWRHRRWGYGRQ